MPPDLVIQAQGLSKLYRIFPTPADRLKHSLWRGRRRFHREFWALRDVNFDVERGETFGIVGRNGSGKTTVLQILAGIMQPTAGSGSAKGRVAALLELGAGFAPEFTGRENAVMNATLMGLSRQEIKERIDSIVAFADVGEFFDQPVKTYSTGMFVRVAFATAIHVNPEILLIDEALAVGDEAFQRKCFAELRRMRNRGVTIVFVSHDARSVIELCDRAMLLDGGQRLLLGSPKPVITAYHRLLFASSETLPAIRAEILEADRSREEPSIVTTSSAASRPKRSRETAVTRFDPQLRPTSTIGYPERGTRIHDVELLTEDEEPVNLLSPGETYLYRFRVDFSEPAVGVRFGMMLKSVTGLDLGGQVSHPQGEGLEFVEAGTSAQVTFRIRNRLAPGPYSFNAGCVAIEEGEEVYLHRIIDALMLRILPDADSLTTAYVDFSEDPGCEVALTVPSASRLEPGDEDARTPQLGGR